MSCAKLGLRLLAPWAACMLGRFAAAIHIADHGDGTYVPTEKVAVRLPVIFQSSDAKHLLVRYSNPLMPNAHWSDPSALRHDENGLS
eukprot:COSAG03_NODE_9800_length_692_cov_4.357504_1_plen_86_part_10